MADQTISTSNIDESTSESLELSYGLYQWEDLLEPHELRDLELLEKYEPNFRVRASVKERALILVNQQRRIELLNKPELALLSPVELRTLGFTESSRILGHDLSLNDNLVMAGWLHLIHQQRTMAQTLQEYLQVLDRRLNPRVKAFIQRYTSELEQLLNQHRWVNFRYTYTSARSLTDLYLLKPRVDSPLAESASHMFMRVAVQFFADDGLQEVIRCYLQLIEGRFVPATPTLLNAGTKRPQMSSCFLMAIDDDLPSMYLTLFNGAMLSASKGGLGIDFSPIRHSEIDEVSMSSGVVPLLKVFDGMLVHVDQGGKRKGAASVFLRPHHLDILDFINLTDPMGDHNARAHNLNTSIWTPWIFWQRVRENGDWTLFCPNKVPQLNTTFGKDFERLYVEAEADPSVARGFRRTIKARELLSQMHRVERSSGKPFIMNGDSCNFKSPHKHLGYIRSSNLCVPFETPLLTRTGYHQIGELEGRQIEVWNGLGWSNTTVERTGNGMTRPLISICFSDGTELRTTFNHIFLLQDNEVEVTEVSDQQRLLRQARRVMAVELKPGMKILSQLPLPIVLDAEEGQEFKHPYTHAVFSILGCEKWTYDKSTGNRIVSRTLELYGPHSELAPHIELENGELPRNLPQHRRVPLNSGFKTHLEWMAGLLDSGGRYVGDGLIEVKHGDSKFLSEVQLLGHLLGMRGQLRQSPSYSLTFTVHEILRLVTLGLPIHLLNLKYSEVRLQPLSVESITNYGESEVTFCLKESQYNTATFSGILTGQCLEIIEYTDRNTVNVCNLCSINLPFYSQTHKTPASDFRDLVSRVDFTQYGRQVRDTVVSLNRVIDSNFYPKLQLDNREDKLKETNHSHRAIGLGIQGMAELFYRLDLPYTSEWARKLDEMIYASLYYNALVSSCQLAILEGKCSIFEGSSFSMGKLQFHLWSDEHILRWGRGPSCSGIRRYEDTLPLSPLEWGQETISLRDPMGNVLETLEPCWDKLALVIQKYGLRNSLLTCQMPTASTSRIMGNCESFEVHLRNIYGTKVINGDFPFLNGWMARDLEDLGLWTPEVIQYIIGQDAVLTGLSQWISQNPDLCPDFDRSNMERLRYLELKYKTMWEVPQKEVLIRAANRGKYLDQSQSMSLFMLDPSDQKLRAAHLMADELGLKTIMYYLRTQSSRGSGKITTSSAAPVPQLPIRSPVLKQDIPSKSREFKACNDEICHSCSG